VSERVDPCGEFVDEFAQLVDVPTESSGSTK
jgi:hypothetical protein